MCALHSLGHVLVDAWYTVAAPLARLTACPGASTSCERVHVSARAHVCAMCAHAHHRQRGLKAFGASAPVRVPWCQSVSTIVLVRSGRRAMPCHAHAHALPRARMHELSHSPSEFRLQGNHHAQGRVTTTLRPCRGHRDLLWPWSCLVGECRRGDGGHGGACTAAGQQDTKRHAAGWPHGGPGSAPTGVGCEHARAGTRLEWGRGFSCSNMLPHTTQLHTLARKFKSDCYCNVMLHTSSKVIKGSNYEGRRVWCWTCLLRTLCTSDVQLSFEQAHHFLTHAGPPRRALLRVRAARSCIHGRAVLKAETSVD